MNRLTPLVTTIAVMTVLLAAGCGESSTPTPTAAATTSGASCPSSSPQSTADTFTDTVTLTTAADGLQTGDFQVGCGTAAKTGSSVTVMYTGWLASGTQFDSSRTAGRTSFNFVIGQQQVIPGWEEGVSGMKPGGKRRLVIPPDLAYGAQGYPPVIPANATLTFDVELLSVQ